MSMSMNGAKQFRLAKRLRKQLPSFIQSYKAGLFQFGYTIKRSRT